MRKERKKKIERSSLIEGGFNGPMRGWDRLNSRSSLKALSISILLLQESGFDRHLKHCFQWTHKPTHRQTDTHTHIFTHTHRQWAHVFEYPKNRVWNLIYIHTHTHELYNNNEQPLLVAPLLILPLWSCKMDKSVCAPAPCFSMSELIIFHIRSRKNKEREKTRKNKGRDNGREQSWWRWWWVSEWEKESQELNGKKMVVVVLSSRNYDGWESRWWWCCGFNPFPFPFSLLPKEKAHKRAHCFCLSKREGESEDEKPRWWWVHHFHSW